MFERHRMQIVAAVVAEQPLVGNVTTAVLLPTVKVFIVFILCSACWIWRNVYLWTANSSVFYCYSYSSSSFLFFSLLHLYRCCSLHFTVFIYTACGKTMPVISLKIYVSFCYFMFFLFCLLIGAAEHLIRSDHL